MNARARTTTGEERLRLWKKARSNFGRPTPTISSRPSARYRWSCWIQSIRVRGGRPPQDGMALFVRLCHFAGLAGSGSKLARMSDQ